MKNRAVALIITLIMGVSGKVIYNYTGRDIIMPDGTTIVSHDLTESTTKFYKNRSIADSLTIYIHHTAGSKSQSLESIAKYHVEKRGWPAIAYHVAINDDGDIFFLNDIEEKTFHNSKDNLKGIAVVGVGNYENYEPSEKMVESIEIVTDAMCQGLKIKAIKGHKDSKATACPGKYLYNRLKRDGILMQR